MSVTVEEIIESVRMKLVEKLMDSMGRFDAERMAGIFFHFKDFDGKTVAEYLVHEVLENQSRK